MAYEINDYGIGIIRFDICPEFFQNEVEYTRMNLSINKIILVINETHQRQDNNKVDADFVNLVPVGFDIVDIHPD
jgi:hypothetical protein